MCLKNKIFIQNLLTLLCMRMEQGEKNTYLLLILNSPGVNFSGSNSGSSSSLGGDASR